ncbi:MAG: hypothetical protein AB8H12_18210 [Lewinella sp.]
MRNPTPIRFLQAFPVLILSVLLFSVVFSSCDQQVHQGTKELSPETPYDVNIAEKSALEKAGDFNQVQRLFEDLSWKLFIALNWPQVDSVPASSITGEGAPIWDSWKESYEVFKSDGSQPLSWGEFEYPDFAKGQSPDCKLLYRTSKFSHLVKPDEADEIDQAFSAPIWDQNGNIVRYEVRMNEVEFSYLVKNELYNFDGQIAFSDDGTKVIEFPSGNETTAGAIELKIAWKIIEDDDPFAERYFTKKACVLNRDRETFHL